MTEFLHYTLFPYTLTASTLEATDEQSIFLRDYMSKLNYKTNLSATFATSSLASEDVFVLNRSELLFFKDMIMCEFNKFKNVVMRLDDTTFEMTTSWFTKTPKGYSSEFHIHSNSMFSGVYYFDDSSDLQFQNYSIRHFYVLPNEWNDFNCTNYSIQPKKNMIVFFDSRLHHRVSPNNDEVTRYSLAFNFIPTSSPFEGDSQICWQIRS